MMEVWKDFTFEAAHKLAGLPEGHKCLRLHGHSYRVRVVVEGELNALGMVMDYADISEAWQAVHDALDHRYLNDILDLNPTTENVASFIWSVLSMKAHIRGVLARVEVRETCTAGAIYRGPS